MLLNSWSLVLIISSLLVVFLLAVAARSAVRVLRFWDPARDDSRQISLESEIWLSSTLVSYALGVQILSLVLLVLAADDFAAVISGAMCATGTLLANPFGLPALLVKLLGVFLYGGWLVLHRLDISSEHYPLVRHKCWYLLALLPWLAADIGLQSLYLLELDPDVIVSCCAVVFRAGDQGSQLLVELAGERVLPVFYAAAGGLLLLGAVTWWRLSAAARPAATGSATSATAGSATPAAAGSATPDRANGERLRAADPRLESWLVLIYGAGWLLFLPLALLAITVAFSSYIYAMPYHNCPFCILQPAYHYIGFAIYIPLLLGAFYGFNVPLASLFSRHPHLAESATAHRRHALAASLLLLILFTAIASYHYLRYMIGGGQW
ncbi:MAG: hypothetical protein U5J62_02630 [Desulfurivibrio sp.]|nr:hypothetical protein [Desulfurivibrio sp.]